MSRYIKLEDIQAFPIRIDHCDHKNGNIHFILGIEAALEYIDYLPQYEFPDAEPIDRPEFAYKDMEQEPVRCKDCKFGEEQINGRYICTHIMHCQSKSNDPNFSCSDGEKFDEDEEEYHIRCPFCKHDWRGTKPFPPFCPSCGKEIINIAVAERF